MSQPQTLSTDSRHRTYVRRQTTDIVTLPFCLMMNRCRAFTFSATWKRLHLLSGRKFKSSTQIAHLGTPGGYVHGQRTPAPNPMAEMVHDRDHLEGEAATLFDAIINGIKPGEIPRAMFSDAKRLVIHCCRESKPWLATQLLDRMVEESLVNPAGDLFYRGIFNMTISAWAKQHRPDMAEQVFALMRNAHAKNPDIMPAPDHYSYNTLMVAWSGNESSTAIDRVLELFQEMEDSEDLKPDAYTFNTVMSSLANHSSEYGTAKAAEDILLRFSEKHSKGLLDEGPSTVSFNIVMKAWSNSGEAKGADRAMEIYLLMRKLYAEGHENVKPDEISLIALMNAYAQKGDVETAERLLRESEVEGALTNAYNCAITAYVKARRPDAGDRAEQLMAEMEMPDEKTFSMVLNAHAQANRPDAANRSEVFLTRGIERYLTFQSDIKPNKKLFLIVLQAWKECSDKQEAAERSFSLLKVMHGLSRDWMLQTEPDSSSYSLVIEMLAEVDVHKAAEQLEKALECSVVPSVHAVNTVLAKLVAENNHTSLEKACRILDDMDSNKVARTSSFNQVIRGIVTVQNSLSKKKVLELLERMEKGFQAGNKMVRPNMYTYQVVMKELGRSPTESDARIGGDIFSRMKRLHSDSDNTWGEMDIRDFSLFLSLLSRAGSEYAAEKATEVFNSMLSDNQLLPDGACLSLVILANARVPSARFTHVAHNLLLESMKLYLEGGTKQYPSRPSVLSVLHAWSRCQENCAPIKVLELLDVVKHLHEAGVTSLKPNNDMVRVILSILWKDGRWNDTIEAEKVLNACSDADINSWHDVLRMWSKSSAHDKAVRAQKLFRKMQNTDGAPIPNTTTFNIVLITAMRSDNGSDKQRLEALNVANDVFEELKRCDHAKPDMISYGTMMQCQRKLMEPSDERNAAIRAVFELCKNEGFVGGMAINELATVLTPNDFNENGILAHTTALSFKKLGTAVLPHEWTRNVPHDKK